MHHRGSLIQGGFLIPDEAVGEQVRGSRSRWHWGAHVGSYHSLSIREVLDSPVFLLGWHLKCFCALLSANKILSAWVFCRRKLWILNTLKLGGFNHSLLLASAGILWLMQSPPASRGPFQNTDTIMHWWESDMLPDTTYKFQASSGFGRELNPKFGPISSNSLRGVIIGLIYGKLLSYFLRVYNIYIRPSSGANTQLS